MTAAERNLHAIASTFAGLPAAIAPKKPAPVRVIPCWVCGGEGYVPMTDDRETRCSICAGKGRIATEGGEV